MLLRTTKLAQSTSQYYFVLQSSHKVLPSTSFVLQSSHRVLSQYYFVLQSSHKALPSTTSYYKARTEYCPSTTSYNKARTKLLPSTTSYYKARTKYFPGHCFVLHSLHKVLQNRNFVPTGGFARLNLHFQCERVAPDGVKLAHFTAVFDDQNLLPRAKGLRRTVLNSQFYLSYCRSNFISCETVATQYYLI